jgi:hypothetical protein
MSSPNETAGKRPMAEPATQQSGNEVGGMRAGADHGFSDPTQRSMEHADTSPLGRASTGDIADPRLDLGGKEEPGGAETPSGPAERPATDERPSPSRSAAGATPRANADEDEEWRHEPVAPVDERNPLKSFGRAIADVATGGAETASTPQQRDR